MPMENNKGILQERVHRFFPYPLFTLFAPLFFPMAASYEKELKPSWIRASSSSFVSSGKPPFTRRAFVSMACFSNAYSIMFLFSVFSSIPCFCSIAFAGLGPNKLLHVSHTHLSLWSPLAGNVGLNQPRDEVVPTRPAVVAALDKNDLRPLELPLVDIERARADESSPR
eukprot:CAMPEP_0198269060 /NCGR_PEP_ID=MMETSP1447-20131203/39829_1 /TAXON_ID=420782 /ORGANISM="Chaetoceros dichaeta, Strain CCMP1751" /LENGTH=168 /DNA_ID=CAMNT_0043960453 /DNA_START=148 /DNA_END=651 /DNA_ORIENTATION=-